MILVGPTLYLFSGLPGSGKSTLAQAVARRLQSAYLRIDTIEQGLRELCSVDVQGEGYRLAYRIAADNLRLGTSVVADSCNPIELTRHEWEQVALDAGVRYVNIEIVCPDIVEHRRRVETRARCRDSNCRHGATLRTASTMPGRKSGSLSTRQRVLRIAWKNFCPSYPALIFLNHQKTENPEPHEHRHPRHD